MSASVRFFARMIARWLKVTWLTRGQADMKAMREFITRLKNGGVMVIAPEGTRSKTASLFKAEPGAIYIASSAGVGIIPVALTGTEDAEVVARWRKFKKLKITITAGDEMYFPPDIKSVKGAEQDILLQSAMDEVMCRIAALLPESYRGYYRNFPGTRKLLEKI
ncbi:MAG: lysophospholipid acyltransferase family protein [Anaerolineales bacterium]